MAMAIRGYQELATRYDTSDEVDSAAKVAKRSTKTRSRRGGGAVPERLTKVVNWLDRRD